MFRFSRAERGITLVELVVMIVVVGIFGALAAGLIGRLSIQNADPLVMRTALIAADALLAEVMSQGTEAQDPDGVADALGPEPGEMRLGQGSPFDHVNDYHGYTQNGLTDLEGTALAGLQGYRSAVTVRTQGIDTLAADQGWWIEVQITTPDNRVVSVSGWRARLTQ